MAFFLEDIWVSSHDLLIRTPVTGYGPSLNQYDLILTIYICYFQISLYAEVLGRREFGGGALFNSVQNICFEGVSFYVVGLFVYIWCWSWNSSTLATSGEELTHWRRLWCWEGLGQEEKGTSEDEMAGWHHRLDGQESEWTPGVGDGQGGLACCNSWGRKESDMTERLNWTEVNKNRNVSFITPIIIP